MRKTRRLSTSAACLLLLTVLCSPLYAVSDTERVLELVNTERVKAGVRPLKMNSELTESARRYAVYLGQGGFFGHVAPNGSTVVTRNIAAGYSDPVWLGENIAAGFSEPEVVIGAWMNSVPHRSNILDPNFAEIGIATAFVTGSPYGRYWVQEFGVKTDALLGSATQSDTILQRAGRAPALRNWMSKDREGKGVVSAGGLQGQIPASSTEVRGRSIPVITGIGPSAAPQGGVVQVSGRGFGGSGTLRFGGLIAAVDSWSDKLIVARVPEGAISAGVTVANDSGVISMGAGFRVTQGVVVGTAPVAASPAAPQKADDAVPPTVE